MSKAAVDPRIVLPISHSSPVKLNRDHATGNHERRRPAAADGLLDRWPAAAGIDVGGPADRRLAAAGIDVGGLTDRRRVAVSSAGGPAVPDCWASGAGVFTVLLFGVFFLSFGFFFGGGQLPETACSPAA
jgi:hypothetical protein